MRLLFLTIATVSLLAGCGWQLRGTQAEQLALPGITVVSKNAYSPMALTLRSTWQAQANNDEIDATYIVRLLEETVDRRPVTYTASGTPAQYEMTLQLTYAIQRVGTEEPTLPRTLATHRIFDFDPRNIVAKSEEERELLRHMRQQLAQQLLSHLSRKHNLYEDN